MTLLERGADPRQDVGIAIIANDLQYRTALEVACAGPRARDVPSNRLIMRSDPLVSFDACARPLRDAISQAACHYSRIECLNAISEFVSRHEGTDGLETFLNQRSAKGRTALTRACQRVDGLRTRAPCTAWERGRASNARPLHNWSLHGLTSALTYLLTYFRHCSVEIPNLIAT